MKKSYFFIAGMILLIFLVFGVYFPVVSRYRTMKLEEEELDTKIQNLDEKIKSLTEERDLLKNDKDYLEKVIRQELGLVKPGEIVYRFITDAIKKQSASSPEAEPVEGILQVSQGVSLSPNAATPKPKAAVPASNPPAALAPVAAKSKTAKPVA